MRLKRKSKAMISSSAPIRDRETQLIDQERLAFFVDSRVLVFYDTFVLLLRELCVFAEKSAVVEGDRRSP